jgi:hypothetical protein
MHTIFNALAGLVLAAVSVEAAGIPAYTGALQFQPGISSLKCLTAASNSDGARVTIQDCVSGQQNQMWVMNNGVNVRVFGNKCLDVPEGKTTDGTKLQIWTCSDGNQNQMWDYNKWTNKITWLNKNKCLDLTDSVQTNGNRMQIWKCSNNNINQVWNAGYPSNNLPATVQFEQSGTNRCIGTEGSNSNCQTAWINSADDFCIFGPPRRAPIGDIEREAVAYCTKSGRGTRTMPNGTLKGVHFVKTPEYVQITGVGNFTKINVPKGDAGGELDNRGADGKGNPIGGLLFGNTFGQNYQYHEWTSFLSDSEFCIRACVGARATSLCNHIYDRMGCRWNIVGNYNANQFENCESGPALPMGVYGTSTYKQGATPVPAAHPAPQSSNCKTLPTVTLSPAVKRRDEKVVKRVAAPFPGATPLP